MTFRRRRSMGPTSFLAAVTLIAAFWISLPAPGFAQDASVQSLLLGWMNRDRLAHGLVPYRLDARLVSVAQGRASEMASTGVLAHASGGTPNVVAADGIQWFSCGENVGMTTAEPGIAASYLYEMWRNSPDHWALMMSTTFNYVGIGVAYKSATGATYASMIFTEAADHTRPGARMTGGSLAGTTISFTWRGWDPLLQTHTAGLRYFDVEYRIDDGAWRLVRNNTTTTSMTLRGRAHGHAYALRVRAWDGRGNASAYSTRRVWVP